MDKDTIIDLLAEFLKVYFYRNQYSFHLFNRLVRHTHTCFYSIFSLLILIVGCKEEKDTRIPEIYYSSPQFRQEFSVLDTITVEAAITDQKMITSVKVNLTNDQFIPVSEARTFAPNMPSFQLSTKLVIDDENLESGTYYVLIRAENGESFRNKYQEISIRGSEQEFIQLLIVSDGGFLTVKVDGSSDFETTTPLFEITGDFAASAISSAHQLLFIAGKNSPNVEAYHLGSNTLAWSLEPTPGKPMHNAGCLHFNSMLYTSYNYSFIQGYTPTGQTGFNVPVDEADAPGRVYRHHDRVLAEIQKKNNSQPHISTYFPSTGNEKQRRFIDFDVIEFISWDNEQVAVITNRDGQGQCYLYNVESDVLTPGPGSQEPFTSAVKTAQEALVVAGTSTVFAYFPVQGLLIPILEEGAMQVVYEHLSGSLILGQQDGIRVYQFPEMVNQKTLLFSDTILDLQIQYSK